ncbi:MAG: NAD regulator [Hyphomonadaceae bacterium]|jgi:hypothetical protein|nr:NAD regulator [Hyphomonadaceae bacterium]
MSSPVRHKGGALKVQPLPTPAATQTLAAGEGIPVVLTSAILALQTTEPVVAVVPAGHTGDETLPSGFFLPSEHDTLEDGVRSCTYAQTGVEFDLIEQLCTLGGRARSTIGGVPADPPHLISISYVALVGPRQCSDSTRATWRSWYSFLPWEDWRGGRPDCLSELEQRLEIWAAEPRPPCAARWKPDRRQRLRIAFGGAGTSWDEEKVGERYALLSEAGIVGALPEDAPGIAQRLPRLMHPLLGDQSLVLARAIGELRRAIKCRPIIFELMHQEFTLFELQKAVEAILGPHLHKQNFRRLVEGCGLVEPTGGLRLRTGGRPAQLYRFRRDVIYEHAAPGVRLKPGRV